MPLTTRKEVRKFLKKSSNYSVDDIKTFQSYRYYSAIKYSMNKEPSVI